MSDLRATSDTVTSDAVTSDSDEEIRELADARRLSSAPSDGVGNVDGPDDGGGDGGGDGSGGGAGGDGDGGGSGESTGSDGAGGSSARPRGPALGPLGWLRWCWRQLTSMRVALILLFLLSVAAIPGSLVPQQAQSPMKVADFRKNHTTLSPIYDALDMFDVFGSFWFAAIYLLLFISLAGCILPRSGQFITALRSLPPKAPRNLKRLPAHTAWTTGTSDPDTVLLNARKLLHGRRFRVAGHGDAIASEKGYLREAGNLVFHISLFGMLLAMALGGLLDAKGGKLVVEGDGFANSMTQYDQFDKGPWYNTADFTNFHFSLDKFTAKFQESGPQRGTATEFKADVTYTEGEGRPKKKTIEVNHPLEIGNSKVYLLGHGFAPKVTVRDARGVVVFRGAVPFLQQDSNFTSNGVIKVQDDYHNAKGTKEQLAFTGMFVPTFKGGSADGGMASAFPEARFPVLLLTAFRGDLGTDSGVQQNVYQLDQDNMTQFKRADGKPFAVKLLPGEEMKLPKGAGSLTFDGLDQWATFQVSVNPGTSLALWSAVAALAGLMGSLFVKRRRVWVRARPAEGGGVRIEVAGLGRSESARIGAEVDGIAAELRRKFPAG